jgi:hypothetical protein
MTGPSDLSPHLRPGSPGMQQADYRDAAMDPGISDPGLASDHNRAGSSAKNNGLSTGTTTTGAP